ncbi:MAG: redox-regulated ATPase YchF [Spirochaetia bacterium]|jgi:GTP-binding protein YchF|nr:redox-regulated ATPase YchF [Spirochaetia bacterium]
MALNCGIVGLPTVGKTTIFTALTRVKAEVSNYSSAKNPNLGIIAVPDKRLDTLTEMFKPKRRVPATIQFTDIAGLASAASKKEGATNQLLSHIRDSAVLIHVLRCFDDPDVPHVANKISPVDDLEMLHLELALADLETVDKRAEKLAKELKDPQRKKEAEQELAAYAKIRPALQDGKPARSVQLEKDEAEAVKRSFLITMKREIYVCNTDEAGVSQGNAYIEAVKARAAEEGTEAVVICGKFEAELGDLETEEEKQEFLAELGLKESGLSNLINAAYRLLGLRTFFTAGEDECRAWTIKVGDKAPQAAGVIHTDFERGFIKAEVYHFEDLATLGSEHAVKVAGKLRQEGKEYVVQDGDVIFFKFNV